MIKLGSLFAGIGGFDLGAQWAFDRAGIPHKVLFQVEQNKYCQSILKKHWPDARIFDDVCAVGRHNLPDIDILMGGFPCQDISVAGHQKGVINGEKSSLWFEMLRIISELRPRVAVLENVPAIIRVGGPTVVGGLAEIGYDCEWQIISAKQFGAPHLRKRWFCVATDTNRNTNRERRENRQGDISCEKGVAFVHETDCEWKKSAGQKNIWYYCGSNTPVATANTNRSNSQKQSMYTESMEQARLSECGSSQADWQNKGQYWKKGAPVSPICSVDDGIPDRVARLKALGNAIVPQCSEYIFQHIIKNIIQNS